MPESNDITGAVKAIAAEYAKQTTKELERYYSRTTSAISEMSHSITNMANAVQRSAEQLVRQEERQSANTERMERIETVVRDLGVRQRNFEDEINDRLKDTDLETQKNSQLRNAILWLAGAVILGLIGLVFTYFGNLFK